MIRGKDIFKELARNEIRKLLPRIEDSSNSEKMTLFADAVACNPFKFSGIDDRSWARIGKMLFYWPVTPLACNYLRRKWRGVVFVARSRNRQRAT